MRLALLPLMRKHRQYVDEVTMMIEAKTKQVESEAVRAAKDRVRFL
ncbi:MAG: hypothetical protein U0361_03150 [Nitrospiraceae bacterium]